MAGEDMYRMHKLVLRFDAECRSMKDRNGIFHLKLKVINIEESRILSLVSFLELAVCDLGLGDVSVRYYLDGNILHLLVGFLESEYAALVRSQMMVRVRSVDNETAMEESDQVVSGSVDSVL